MSGNVDETVYYQLMNIIEPYTNDKVAEDLGQLTVNVCERFKPDLKAEAKRKIKHPVSKKPYVNYFKVKPLKDEAGGYKAYGCVLYNKQYYLSHLIEDSHYVGGGGHTHNDYRFWKHQKGKMVNYFFRSVDCYIDKLGSK